MSSNYELLISKINEFTQKFYLNKLLRGSIYAAALILAVYLFLFVLIYYTQPGPATKTALFFGFILISIAALVILIAIPGLAYFKLGKNLSIEQASAIIGAHFFNVKDKLLNTLQLKQMADSTPENSQLILAGIDQKIAELNPIPFSNAIKLGDNRKYIKYFLAPASVILLIAIIAPAILRDGTSSFVQYDRKISPKAPFDFVLLNKTLVFSQGDDMTIQLKITGNEIPQEIYLSDGLNSYKLEKESTTNFSYTFKNLHNDKKIQFSGGGYNSEEYVITVKPRPTLLNITAKLSYPAYLHKNEETIQNAGELLVPEGTKINWVMNTENATALSFMLGDQNHTLQPVKNQFMYSAMIKQAVNYGISPKNSFVTGRDSISHQINVVKDQYPLLTVIESPDSLSSKIWYFSGNISDDHGFSALKFRYNLKENGVLKSTGTRNVPIKKEQLENAFFHFWNLNEVPSKPGQVLEYYFEVSDNDGVNGPKITRSAIKVIEVPSTQQVAEKLELSSSALKQKMEKAIKLAATVEKESKKLGETLLDKKQLSFDDKKQIEQLLNKQKELDKSLKDIKDSNQKNTLEKQENNVLKQELLDKQQQIDDLFNHVLDEKTKALLEKLQQLMEQNNKDQAKEELSNMQMENKEVKNELNRILELYKQLEFEQNLQQNIDQLNDLAKDQKALSKKTADKNSNEEQLKSDQQKLTNAFEQLKKDLDKLAEKNQQLERPNAFKTPEEEARDINKQQKASEEQLDKGNKKDAAERQQKAGNQMEQLAKQLKDSKDAADAAEDSLNAKDLRQLLENLLKTSFDQEKVMLNLKNMNSSDPLYTANVQKQRGIKDNMKTIADSLYSLSKKVTQIASTVNDEMQKINFNIDKSIENLGDRNTPAANSNQQYTMTAINNLSLMLNEALDQLQHMKNAKSGSGGKPGKKGMKQLQEMQEQLNNNMQKAKDQLQKQGNKGTVPKGQMSQEFSKMAQQQQMIREALQKINREENKDGKGGLGNLNKLIEDMKATESELVNKRLEQETLNRQKEVLTKLLDAQNAQREQDQEAKRESKTAKDFPPSYQQMLDKFKKLQKTESEWLQKLPPDLNYYYKNKITTYFKLLNSGR